MAHGDYPLRSSRATGPTRHTRPARPARQGGYHLPPVPSTKKTPDPFIRPEGIRRGVDMFDCVMPTRNGRNALAFTDEGTLRLRNLKHRLDDRPLDENCSCAACRRSRGYLRHLFAAKEMLGPILLSLHNITYYQRLLADARKAIQRRRFEEFAAEKYAGWAAESTDSSEDDSRSGSCHGDRC